VLAGGEVAAATIIEATARLVPEVLGDAGSRWSEESFVRRPARVPPVDARLHPALFRGLGVPEVLLSGNHGRSSGVGVAGSASRAPPCRAGPDLLERWPFDEEERAMLDELERT